MHISCVCVCVFCVCVCVCVLCVCVCVCVCALVCMRFLSIACYTKIRMLLRHSSLQFGKTYSMYSTA